MRDAIEAGNIVRRRWPLRMKDHVNLYLGSGRCGACFDAFGLMGNGLGGAGRTSQGNTTLMHADHWHRGDWGLDYWLPVARLVWAGEPYSQEPPDHYRQELHLYDGVLRTELGWPGLRLEMAAHFHPDRRDLLAVHLRYDAVADDAMPSLLLAPETDVRTHYNQHLTGTAETLHAGANWWVCRVKVGTADSAIELRVVSTLGKAELRPTPEGMAIDFRGEQGRHLLLIGVAGSSRRGEVAGELSTAVRPEQFAAEAREAWHRRWGSAFIRVPVPEYQALWARSLYYTLCSYAPDVRSPAPPNGWSGNGWPFHFPQDVSYIHPALLRLGHLDVARSWVDFYRERLENMQDYTRRIYKAEGAMWAWEFPIGPDSKLLADGTPNWCQFEIHNAAYPARMAREASRFARDAAWTREAAWPVVRESARFFGSVLRKEGGTWGIEVKPSFGQDEMGGQDAKNYLCALFSARYALQTALAMADELGQEEPAFGQWRAILADGLAFERLRGEGGILVTCEGLLGKEQIGKEKHPVQLNPLTFLPLGDRPDVATRGSRVAGELAREPRALQPDHVVEAYRRRYGLCAGVRENIYHGWTLAAYWLAASHMGDADGLMHELGQCQPGRYADPDWIQIYETSGSFHMPFYVTSHGLYLQALTDALVTDYWGEPQVGAACPAGWREVAFDGLRTADGRVWSGEKADGQWQVRSE